ncbi:hypothetical protein BJ742DRAFT_777473 [Cladochytrium replicatum]|nr:hypothetical protein BJ742DRAFT_777473 [Cladochytrium replicatum]
MHPLVHGPTGTQLFLCGIHHSSPLSTIRVNRTISELRPQVVCLEVEADTMKQYLFKHSVLHKRSIESASSSNPDPSELSREQIWELVRGGVSASQISSADGLRYGGEIGAAVDSALACGAIVKCIDLHASQWVRPIDPAIIDFKETVRRRYKVNPPRDRITPSTTVDEDCKRRRMSWAGRAVYSIASYAIFRKDIDKHIESDFGTPHELALQARLESVLDPVAMYYLLHLRNAGMVERIREIVHSLASHRETTDGSPPRIVAVVGKAHVLGMASLWGQFVENERVDRKRSSRVFPKVASDIPDNYRDWIAELEGETPPAITVVQGSIGSTLQPTPARPPPNTTSKNIPTSVPLTPEEADSQNSQESVADLKHRPVRRRGSTNFRFAD